MNAKSVLIALALLLAGPGFAGAVEKTFENPKQGGQRLDWCKTFQQDCGKPAANAWCVSKDYKNAANFTKEENVGKTRTIGDGSICEDSNCDSFSQITCFKPLLFNINAQYDQPMFKNYRLDWCYAWSKQCGKPAADAFCKLNGHSDAQSFTKAPGLAATRVISTSQVCDGNCDGFEQIICNP